MLVGRVERIAAGEQQKDNPLFVGDVLIYPNLGEPMRKSREKALTFFIEVMPGAGASPEATLQILRSGETVAQAPSTLPVPDSSGRIRHIAQVSIDALSPGRYILRLTVTQGERREMRSAGFELR